VPCSRSLRNHIARWSCSPCFLDCDADRFGVRRAKDLLADVRGVLENWTSYANEAKLGMATTGRVSKEFRLL
jgi:hypothetical protein